MSDPSVPATGEMFELSEKKNVLSFTISSSLELVEDFLIRFKEFSNHYGCVPSQNVKLVIRELVINAVEHGNDEDPDKCVKGTIEIEPDDVFRITVEDEGGGFDYQNVNMEIPEPYQRDRQRGYPLIATLSKKIDFTDPGNRVTVWIKNSKVTDYRVFMDADWRVVHPTGNITAASADSLRVALKECLEKGNVKFRFELENVEDVDSMGVCCFVVLAKQLKDDPSHKLVIVNARESVKTLFHMTRLDKLYTFTQ